LSEFFCLKVSELFCLSMTLGKNLITFVEQDAELYDHDQFMCHIQRL